jgi:thiosulfate/3-mercaptopyruvate sulfurtransferase
LPSLKTLSNCFQRLGVGEQYHVILYSKNGMQWSARIWWMLRAVGFDQVSILNGGFTEWMRLELPIEKEENVFNTSKLLFKPRLDIFVGKDAVLEAINKKSTLLLNSLTEDIYLGNNPRYGRRGRIPNSINIPFNQLLNKKNGKIKPIEEVIEIFNKKNVTSDSLILNYCGGGIAASLEAFVLFQLGFQNIQIYDNSMSEWAMDKELPIEIG